MIYLDSIYRELQDISDYLNCPMVRGFDCDILVFILENALESSGRIDLDL